MMRLLFLLKPSMSLYSFVNCVAIRWPTTWLRTAACNTQTESRQSVLWCVGIPPHSTVGWGKIKQINDKLKGDE